MKLLKCIVVGGIVASSSQVFAQEDTASELRSIKVRMKQLEQRIEGS